MKNKSVIPVLLFSLGILILMGTDQGHAAAIRFGNLVPGAGIINKQMISQREARFRNLIEQHTDFSCGAAALATILKHAYAQDNITEEKVLRELFKVSDVEQVRQRGFSLLDLKRYVQTLGMRGRGYRLTAKSIEKVKVPSIVLLDIKGYRHFVVFKKATPKAVYLGDPALGNRIMSKDDFIASWNGVIFAVIGNGFNTDTVLLRPTRPLTAQGLKAVHVTINEVALLDFGFTHTNLF